jgi:cyclic-di-GMP-binding protein
MASSFSFDIVSDFDYQELVNAIDQAQREIDTRYDLKDSKTEIDLKQEEIIINTASQFTLDAVMTIIQTKASKRLISLKIFDPGTVESASGARVRQTVKLKKGIDQEIAKKVSKAIRDGVPKVQVSIQGDALRVTGKSKDDLQLAMQFVKQGDWPADFQFTNYR